MVISFTYPEVLFPFELITFSSCERGDCPGDLAPLFIHRTDTARAAAVQATPSHPVPLCPNPDLEGPALGVREGFWLVQCSAALLRGPARVVALFSPDSGASEAHVLPPVGRCVLHFGRSKADLWSLVTEDARSGSSGEGCCL